MDSNQSGVDNQRQSPASESPATVNHFWFQELSPQDWFRKSATLDERITARFGATLSKAATGALSDWHESPSGRLAEVLVLDQFSRNIHRDSAKAFENDPAALALAATAIDHGADRALTAQQRAFLYMPFMHSESLTDHDTALALYRSLGLQNNLDAEIQHYAIIERFGRYPHRNALLGRENTAAEIAFLSEPGSSF